MVKTYIYIHTYTYGGFPGGISGNEPACQCRRHKETRVQYLGQEDSLEEHMATHSSILAWRSPWTEQPGGLQSIGLQRVGHDWVTNTLFYIHTYICVLYIYTQYIYIHTHTICLQHGRAGFNPWIRKISWRRAWQPLHYSCLENPHGRRSLVGCSPWGCKQSEATEWLSTYIHTW